MRGFRFSLRNLFLAIAVLTVVIGVVTAIKNRFENRITIQNRATRSVSHATIELCGRTYFVENLAPGRSESFSFSMNSVDDYASAKLTFDDGESIHSKNHRVNGDLISNRLRMIVDDAGVRFEP